MCTLIVLHRVVAEAPLVIAANRDEFYERPSEGPAIRLTAGGAVLTPLDLRERGTWLGVNSRGVFAALTNRRADADPQPDRRSRGLLVLEALEAGSAVEAADRIEQRVSDELRRDSSGSEVGAYNPFNLFIADLERAFAITYLYAPQRIQLAPGAHVIGNVAPTERNPKLARIAEEAQLAARATADSVLDELAEVCRGHDGGSVEAACVHAPEAQYGTRSSFLLKIGADGIADDSRSELRYADGAPCKTRYEDFTPLLLELGRGAQVVEGEPVARSAS